MAERAVDLVLQRLAQIGGRFFVPCRTEGIVLSGGDFASPGQIPEFIRELTEMTVRIGLMESQAASLVRKYGTQAQKIVQIALECLSWSESEEIRVAKTQGPTEMTEAMRCLLRAEIQYTIEEEMATNLNDFFIRRTGRLFFERESVPLYLSDALEEFANRLGWTEQERILHQSRFAEEFESATNFD
jgi:glycerol-3-phosphate dehydrogenase